MDACTIGFDMMQTFRKWPRARNVLHASLEPLDSHLPIPEAVLIAFALVGHHLVSKDLMLGLRFGRVQGHH